MLSIGQASAGYYINLAKDDYYHKGTEPAGIWYGQGADALGLSGKVARQDFLFLCAGYHPKAAPEKLVQNAGRENRRAGWDLTFSAPKTVSALWATADEETRKRISAANYSAVLNALDFVQEGIAQNLTMRGRKCHDTFQKCPLLATFIINISLSFFPLY